MSVSALFMIVGLVVAVVILKSYHGPMKIHIGVASVMIGMSPWILWQAFNPPVFDMTAYRTSVDYEFNSFEYAFEFALRNNASVH